MNKHYLLLVLSLIIIQANAQFQDDFSDDDFTQNPTWAGSTELFTIEDQQLRSNSSGESVYYLSTASETTTNAQWEFFINLRFATSGVNYADVFLIADNTDLTAVQNGYFIRLGGTADEISLYKIVDGNQILIIDGEDGVVGSSSNNPYNIRISRDANNFWMLEYDEGSTGVFVNGGSVEDDEIQNSTFFGVRITQSSAASAVNSHYFDDFVVGEIPVDENPPLVTNYQIINSNEIRLFFDEIIEASSAEELSNYSLSPGDEFPLSAVLNSENLNEVTLTFDDEFANGTDYTLTINGVTDLAGNAIVDQTISFTYIEIESATFRDVVFNEIMADPNPQVGLPDAEYVELFNSTENYFNLNGWSFVNTSTAKLLPDFILEPGAFVILCDEEDAEAFSEFGSVIPIESFTALGNTGDSLTLLNFDGVLIDVVSYSDSWYQNSDKDDGGWSIEQINPAALCGGASNWSASENELGGTPGSVNSIFNTTPDIEAPVLMSFSVLNNSTLELTFNEVMDEESLINGDYTIDNEIAATVSSISELSVVLNLNPPLETGVVYTVSVNSVADCSGNEIGDENTIEIILGIVPQSQDIIITEIMADPTPAVGQPEAEYLEIYNRSEEVIDLSGADISGAVFPSGSIIFPGEYKLLVGESQAEQFDLLFPGLIAMEGMSSTFLTNSGKELLVTSASGEIIDRVIYNLNWYKDAEKEAGGWSLEIKNLNEPCRGEANWTASVDNSGGTPAAQNSVYSTATDAAAPVLLSAVVYNSTELILNFNEPLDSLSVYLAEYTFEPELSVTSIENISPEYNQVRIILDEELQPNQLYNVSVSQISDCSGNELSNSSIVKFGLPEPAVIGDVLINEILFNPRTGGSDFVELYNNSDKVLSLQNWEIANDNSQYEISAEPFLLLPDEFVVLTSNPQSLSREYPKGRKENFFEIESLPTFANAGGSVILVGDSGVVLDRFDYSEDFHFQLINDFKGISLERIDYNKPTNNSSNWISAAESAGFATPGYENSQFMQIGFPDADFKVEPEAFSPDNDGFQDVLNLSYQFAESGYIGNIRIFDTEGRLVKSLARSAYLGKEGYFIWDGLTDDQQKARIGVYLIHIEIFDLNGNVKIFKESCVVAGRLNN